MISFSVTHRRTDKWYLILNLELRVIHISNAFEEHTRYTLNDYKNDGIVILFGNEIPDKIKEALVGAEDAEINDVIIFAKNGRQHF